MDESLKFLVAELERLEEKDVSNLRFIGLSEFFDNQNTHKDHEVIVNSAMGKEFKYCRDCKAEV
jgi:hypothetical protein